MAMHYKKEIISPEVLQELYPLTPEQKSKNRFATSRSKRSSPVNPINFLLSLDHVLPITKILCVNI